METLIAGAITAGLAIILVAFLAVLYPLLYAVGGYFTGWVLTDLFTFAGEWAVSGAHAIGLEITLGQLPVIGAMLGFVGAFFKATQTNKNEGK